MVNIWISDQRFHFLYIWYFYLSTWCHSQYRMWETSTIWNIQYWSICSNNDARFPGGLMNLKWGDIELILLAWGISIFFSSYFLSFMSTFYLRNGTPIYHREMPVAANGNVQFRDFYFPPGHRTSKCPDPWNSILTKRIHNQASLANLTYNLNLALQGYSRAHPRSGRWLVGLVG